MALISVVSHCKETAVQLETVLRGRGHEVRSMADSQFKAGQDDDDARETGHFSESSPSLFIVDLDCDPRDAANTVRALTEDPSTALTPVLVAASPESHQQVALACAYGATGLIRKPFSTMETVPDTERALLAATPAQ
jgi:CheY-like chemotaxis protein